LIFLINRIFLEQKMTETKKTPSERQMLVRLSSGEFDFTPLQFTTVSEGSPSDAIDLIWNGNWAGQQALFAVECKSTSSPRTVREAIVQARRYAEANRERDYLPLVVVPFLGEEQLKELEREGVSGVDLCGNGVVVALNKFAIYRTGSPNLFRSSAPIKNIYKRNSSIVGRAFLARPRYEAVSEIQTEIGRRTLPFWRPLSLATISKALKGLEEDLIVSRGDAGISLVQPDKLLEKLARNFTWEKMRPAIRAKVEAEGNHLSDVLIRAADALRLPLVATGTASVSKYAVMQRGPLLSVYCSEPESLLKRVGGTSTDRFPNVEIIEAKEPFFYFDAQTELAFQWASPVQVYLELMAGDKRDRETAEQVKNVILSNVRSQLK
jgi:hypothetical protein